MNFEMKKISFDNSTALYLYIFFNSLIAYLLLHTTILYYSIVCSTFKQENFGTREWEKKKAISWPTHAGGNFNTTSVLLLLQNEYTSNWQKIPKTFEISSSTDHFSFMKNQL